MLAARVSNARRFLEGIDGKGGRESFSALIDTDMLTDQMKEDAGEVTNYSLSDQMKEDAGEVTNYSLSDSTLLTCTFLLLLFYVLDMSPEYLIPTPMQTVKLEFHGKKYVVDGVHIAALDTRALTWVDII